VTYTEYNQTIQKKRNKSIGVSYSALCLVDVCTYSQSVCTNSLIDVLAPPLQQNNMKKFHHNSLSLCLLKISPRLITPYPRHKTGSKDQPMNFSGALVKNIFFLIPFITSLVMHLEKTCFWCFQSNSIYLPSFIIVSLICILHHVPHFKILFSLYLSSLCSFLRDLSACAAIFVFGQRRDTKCMSPMLHNTLFLL
jgi:hypothetical protein